MKMRASTRNLKFICVLWTAMISVAACAISEEPEITPPSFSQDLSQLAPDDFQNKIEELSSIAEKHENADIRTRAHYYAALASMHYNNPSPDYTGALVHLDAFMASETEPAQDRSEVAVWHFVLSQMNMLMSEHEKLQQSYVELEKTSLESDRNYRVLSSQLKNLKQAIETQKKEIAGLEDKIKKLDALHAEIEKKKKKKD